MHVGLGTNRLYDNSELPRASFKFTLFSILGPLVVVAGFSVSILVLAGQNVHYVLRSQNA